MKGSVYMRWAKEHAAARYNLANSGLLACGPEDLDFTAEDVVLNGLPPDGCPATPACGQTLPLSAPIVVSGPWPVCTTVSSGSGSRRSWIESMIVAKLEKLAPEERRGEQVVHGYVEEALYLRRVQVHGQHAVDAGGLEQVGEQNPWGENPTGSRCSRPKTVGRTRPLGRKTEIDQVPARRLE